MQSFQQGGSVVVITGAAGGMGKACARRMGLTHRLVLADISATACEDEATRLREEGYDVAFAIGCDIADPRAVEQLAVESAAAGPLGALIHTAGVSPTTGSWKSILRVNYAGTVFILDAFLKHAGRRSVACCIASNAGHMAPPNPTRESLFDEPSAPDMLAALEAFVLDQAASSGLSREAIAYVTSKRGVLRLVQDRVRDWAAKGARIVSISPGLISTQMGKTATESASTGAAQMLAMTPAERWGTALDIANAAHFLCSAEASFISGCDLLVDGGLTPLLVGRNTKSGLVALA